MYIKKCNSFLVKRGIYLQLTALILLSSFVILCSKKTVTVPIRTAIELDIGESQTVTLSTGKKVNIKLLDVAEVYDDLRGAVRSAEVKVAVDGEETVLHMGNYNLPITAGKVQIDCPVTGGYRKNCKHKPDPWGFVKDARLRLWPADSPLLTPGTFVYPIKQRILADDTQMGNEPVFVDWGEDPENKKIHYHPWLDFAGAEGVTEVVSATDGLIISAGGNGLPGYEDTPVRNRYDIVYVLDDRGWYYRYQHLYSIDPAIIPGEKVKIGQKIGMLGKEGDSGGFAHLHFDINCRQPSGEWGVEDGYAYIWEAYVEQYKPAVVAVARPHKLAWTGQPVKLDGRKSKSIKSEIVKFEWIFCDGSTASGSVQERTYRFPGTYSEVLKVTDLNGNIDYDYTVVNIRDKNNPDKKPPAIHACYHPTLDIVPGEPVTFYVRSFNTEVGNEVWDFGDGSPLVTVKSVIKHSTGKEKFAYRGYDIVGGKYAETVHTYEKPGHYLVRVERENEHGYKAVAHLHVEVESP